MQGLAPDVIKKVLPRLTNLTELDLGGRKITAAVLAVAAKQPFARHVACRMLHVACCMLHVVACCKVAAKQPFAAKLERFCANCLDKDGRELSGSLEPLLKQASRLQSLDRDMQHATCDMRHASRRAVYRA